MRGWRAWARLARTSAARPWGRWGGRVVRGWRAWARLARHFCRASLGEMGGEGSAWTLCSGLQEEGGEGSAWLARLGAPCAALLPLVLTIHPVIWGGRTTIPIRYGAHVANREFALLFGAAFCDDFEEFSDIQVLWADMFALSAFDTLVRCCRLCGEP